MSGRCEKHDNWRAHLGDLIALEQRFDHLRAELAASEALVDALNTQRGLDAVASLRAVEEAREEQREACVMAADRWFTSVPPPNQSPVDAIRATPLDATPLKERIAELEEEVADLKDDFAKRQAAHSCQTWDDGRGDCECDAIMGAAHLARAAAEAERDALKAELAEMCDINLGQVASFRSQSASLKAELATVTENQQRQWTEKDHYRTRAVDAETKLRSSEAQVERLTAAARRALQVGEIRFRTCVLAADVNDALTEALKEKTP